MAAESTEETWPRLQAYRVDKQQQAKLHDLAGDRHAKMPEYQGGEQYTGSAQGQPVEGELADPGADSQNGEQHQHFLGEE